MEPAARRPGLAVHSRWILILAAALMTAGMHYFFRAVIKPARNAATAARDLPGGNLSDLYPRWLGARELFLNDRDPYSDEVTADIQRGYFGRALDPKGENDPVDEQRFAYPLYVVFLLAPTIKLPFESVRTLYNWLAAILSVASVWLWLRAFGHRRPGLAVVIGGMLLLGNYAVVQALLLQQPALIVAALIAAAVAATSAGMFRTAGFTLALAMIKPQSTAAIAGWLLMWAASKWNERRSLFISFLTTMAVMSIGAELLLPGWIWKWRQALSAYMGYAQTPAYLQIFFGRFGVAIGVLLWIAAGILCWKIRRKPADSDAFRLASPLILATNLVASPVWHEYDHMFLLPAVLLVFHWREAFSRLSPLGRSIVRLSAITVGWQWIAAIAVSTASLLSPALARSWQILPWLSLPFSPVPVIAALIVIARARSLRAQGESQRA